MLDLQVLRQRSRPAALHLVDEDVALRGGIDSSDRSSVEGDSISMKIIARLRGALSLEPGGLSFRFG